MHGEIHLSSHTECPLCLTLTKIKMVAVTHKNNNIKFHEDLFRSSEVVYVHRQ